MTRQRFIVVPWLVLVASLAPLGAANPQTIDGVVLDSISNQPVGFGFAVLRTPAGAEVARTLVGYDGRFHLAAPGPGRYQLQSARIGYRTVLSPTIALMAEEHLEYAFHISVIPVRLDAITVTAEQRCRSRPAEHEDTRLVWEEIEKALEAAAWVNEQEMLVYTWYRYDRELDRRRAEVKDEDGWVGRGLSAQLFHSEDADTLAAKGFIFHRDDKVWYHMPDVQTLLDDSFLSTHCFHIVRDTTGAPPRVGLAFEPVEDRELPDVRGVLWLDQRNSRLLDMEVTYTQLPGGVRDSVAGGFVRFLMLPSGAWAVREWEIRAPRLRRRSVPVGRRRFGGGMTVDGYHDTGARILEASTPAGGIIYSAEFGHVSGVVVDSTRNAPLADAVIRFAGSTLAVATDSAGRFQTAVPLQGPHRIVVMHPWLDTIGATVMSPPLDITPGSMYSLVLSAPHVDSIAVRRCGPIALDPAFRLVFGRVWDRDTGRPIADADVAAHWFSLHWLEENALTITRLRQEIATDESGGYALCNLPTRQPLLVRAHDGGRAAAARVMLPADVTQPGLVSKALDWTAPFERPVDMRYPMVKLDFRVAPESATAPDNPGFAGVVFDRMTNEPLADVRVLVNDADSALSRNDGTFGAGARWSRMGNQVTLARLGYQPLDIELNVIDTTTTLAVGFSLSPIAVQLDPVEVIAQATDEHLRRVGFYDRRRLGVGLFLGPQDVEDRARAASTWPELFAAIPGTLGLGVQCRRPLLFVDGLRTLADETDDVFATGALAVQDVAALEVYRRLSEVPAQYRGSGSACGVVLIWTKRGRPEPN